MWQYTGYWQHKRCKRRMMQPSEFCDEGPLVQTHQNKKEKVKLRNEQLHFSSLCYLDMSNSTYSPRPAA